MWSLARRASALVVFVACGAVALAHTPASESAAAVLRFADVPGGPSRAALDAAQAAYDRALELGVVANPRLLTVIDYTLPSVQPRLWVLDLAAGVIAHRELVAHGRGSGDNVATAFSNDDGSHKSSLGLFVTDASYVGHNGYSLRLRGLDPGVNDRAYARSLVIHGADYVSDAMTRTLGRLGRSWGCPAVRPAIARLLIDEIKNGTVVYAFGRATISR